MYMNCREGKIKMLQVQLAITIAQMAGWVEWEMGKETQRLQTGYVTFHIGQDGRILKRSELFM